MLSVDLVQEGLEHVPGLGDGNDAGGAGVVDAVVEVVDAARVHDLLPTDVGAHQLPDACTCSRSSIYLYGFI